MPRADEQRRRSKIHVEARGVKAVGSFLSVSFFARLAPHQESFLDSLSSDWEGPVTVCSDMPCV